MQGGGAEPQLGGDPAHGQEEGGGEAPAVGTAYLHTCSHHHNTFSPHHNTCSHSYNTSSHHLTNWSHHT